MRKIFMHAGTGYCGSDCNQVVEVPDNITDKELDKWAWEEAVQNAANHGYEEHEEGCDCEECEEKGRSPYSNDQIDSYWEEYNPEEHDMLI